MQAKDRIIFFDGHCNLCNKLVNFILKKDKVNAFHFTAIQGESGKKILSTFDAIKVDQMQTLFYLESDRIYMKSDAALQISRHLPYPYKLLFLFRFVPSSVRNVFYDLIARNRYSWFGKSPVCRFPSEEEKQRFLV
jgi:predicted DCC family thiol-disulfide oxidoreductase YuxK